MKKAIYPDEKTNTMKSFTNVFNLFLMSDCGTPSETGYTYTGTTATTYQGTSSVSCATGYSGIANPTLLYVRYWKLDNCFRMYYSRYSWILSVRLHACFFFWHGLRCYFLSIH